MAEVSPLRSDGQPTRRTRVLGREFELRLKAHPQPRRDAERGLKFETSGSASAWLNTLIA